MNIKNNIPKFYLFASFRELMFIIPVIVLFWQANGLSLTQIMILQALFAISIVILEVPTGVVADKVGRKQSLIVGAFFTLLGAIAYFLGTNFWQFFGAEFTWALGSSFISGANSAFVYESLRQRRKQKHFKKIWGNAKSLGYLAAAISGIIGGLVAVYSLRLNWLLVAIGMFFMLMVSLTFKEPHHYKKVKKTSYWQHTKESFHEAFTNKNILFLLLFHALGATIARISLWFYQPYMNESGLPIAYFGIVWASFSIFAITGAKSANKLDEILGENKSLWLVVLLSVLSLVFMSYWFVIFGFIFIFMQQFVRGFSPVIINDYTHKHLSPDKRATLLSIQSMAGSLMFAILGPLYGWFADKYSLSTALMITAVSFFIAFSLLMFWRKRGR